MAKTPVQGVTLDSLSAAHKRTIAGMRRQVLDAARTFGAVRERLSDLAPKVVKLFKDIEGENPSITFVDFTRMFDPSVPTHSRDRDGVIGYLNHRTYYTLQYMRRLVQQKSRPRGAGQGVRDSATDGLARTLKTILQILPEDAQGEIWNVVQAEFGFGERIMTRLRKRVDATKPLFKLDASRVKVGNVIHMDRAAAAEGEALAQPGRNVAIPAEGRRKKAA